MGKTNKSVAFMTDNVQITAHVLGTQLLKKYISNIEDRINISESENSIDDERINIISNILEHV